MKALIVATSSRSPDAEGEIRRGQRYRMDYLELARRLPAAYVDYNSRGPRQRIMRFLEEKSRLDVRWALQVARLVREGGFDTVFSMSERMGIPLSFLLPAGVRHLVTMHHAMSPRKLALVRALRVAHRWDRVTVFSRSEAAALSEILGLSPETVVPLHFPIDTDFYRPMPATGQAGNSFFLSIGLSHRDYPTLLRAMKGLPGVLGEICATSAWINHGDPYGGEDIPSNVRLQPYDHPLAIRGAYARSRFVVVPIDAHTTQWSAGAASVLQPQAMGKPVIATRMPGLADYVLDGETGILVDSGDPRALAEAIRYLWDHPRKAQAMGDRAVDWVREHFSLEVWLESVRRMLVEINNAA